MSWSAIFPSAPMKVCTGNALTASILQSNSMIVKLNDKRTTSVRRNEIDPLFENQGDV